MAQTLPLTSGLTANGNDPSLAEFVAQSLRGNTVLNNVFGADFIQKQIANGTFLGVQTDFDNITGDIFTTTFGRKIWQALNNQTRFFNAINKVEWGNVAGWRVRTDRGNRRSAPITEAGNLPRIDVGNIETVYAFPKIVGSMFGVSTFSTFMSQLEGGAGDILAGELTHCETDHVKTINQMMLSGNAIYVKAVGAGTSADGKAASGADFNGMRFVTVDASFYNHFWPSDQVRWYNATAGHAPATATESFQVLDVTYEDDGDARIWFNTAVDPTIAAGDVVYSYYRAGLQSLDDLITHYNGGFAGQQIQSRAYNLDVAGRTVGKWSGPANDSYNAGIGRDLTLPLLDSVFMNIRLHGGEPRLIVCGHDQYYRLVHLLQAQQRYVGYEEHQVGVGSEKTFPGTRGGMHLATYQNIPILPDPDTAYSTSSSGDKLGSNIYVLDTDTWDIGVARPTTYIENRDYINAGGLVVRGLFYTMMELRCRNLWVNGALRDMNL